MERQHLLPVPFNLFAHFPIKEPFSFASSGITAHITMQSFLSAMSLRYGTELRQLVIGRHSSKAGTSQIRQHDRHQRRTTCLQLRHRHRDQGKARPRRPLPAK